MSDPKWGPTGPEVYRRTYSRPLPTGGHEDWEATVSRVVTGNLMLVYGEPEKWPREIRQEADRIHSLIYTFKILPAGRHLKMSGVPGRQYLFNCHVSGWVSDLAEHFVFTYLRLAEGGGVGANYSSRFTCRYSIVSPVEVHVVCNDAHPDYAELRDGGLLSTVFTADAVADVDVEDSREGWADALALVLRRAELNHHLAGGQAGPIVVDVSRIRFRGAPIKAFGGTASGPAPLARMLLRTAEILSGCAVEGFGAIEPLDAMEIDQAIAECVVSGNVRRSARMSIVHWQDPHIREFIACKSDPGAHWTTNISVEIDDDFVAAVNDDFHPRRIEAMAVLEQVVTGMLTNGEPGLWNSSLSAHGEVGEVIATNPCGEIALEAWENCNLGHVNLDAFVDKQGFYDHAACLEAHRLMTRFLIRATFGDITSKAQAEVVARNRRIGVGHFGAQGWLVKRGIRYSKSWQDYPTRHFLRAMQDTVRAEAREYAFALRIPEPVKCTTVAPTGTVAKLPGRSEGWHPIYAREFVRRIRYGLDDPREAAEVEALHDAGHTVEPCIYSPRTLVVSIPTRDPLVAEVIAAGGDPSIVEAANEISLHDMLSVQAMVQECFADNAVSFTVNVEPDREQGIALALGHSNVLPAPDRVREFIDTMAPALRSLKGTTVMLDGSRAQAPYERITAEEYEAATFKAVDDGFDENCASGACPI
ncbi:ribonucleoside-triphosphate reductase, adenosylcobalamin-dependent [Parafrankia sp. EUN1f]|uniref:ribonucleoside-triphosphate reductase, adenosylcobalamin-dependent n=1 Tax=Parafrankia sp. EUN1f TaxID=102897 RepID=UPI0001C459A2|nr:ribonucleoside-triphosphate reductase, adenosylcobalamin-dependent [Parafrankia sp. EUN1f]EFC86489.1 ribonucleoside-triphosphate reductase, adenosylcobalamin-dependent [Parafrankia sp. EUN1f]